MTSPASTAIRRCLITAVAAALALLLLGVAARASAQTGVAPTRALGAQLGLNALLGSDLGRAAERVRPEPVPTSGNFLLRNGTYTPLEDVRGATYTAYLGTNNRGEFAGYYVDDDGTPHGFRRNRRGRFTTIDAPGASFTFPLDINERGQVVGYSFGPGDEVHGFSWTRGVFTVVDPPDAVVTEAFGINNRGQVVGFYGDAGGAVHGFVWSKGSFTKIDVPGATGSGALDINDRGEIVGAYADAQAKTHGFRVRKGVFTTIDPPGAVDVPGSPGFAATAPFGINNRGQVVGQYADAQGLHAYLLDKGVYRTIDAPAGPGTTATDINDRAQIVIPAPRGLFLSY
jgi:probable HAF family extracellular repeat protein